MTTPTICPACGAPAVGVFCSRCGARLAAVNLVVRERRAWRFAAAFAAGVLLVLFLVIRREKVAAAVREPNPVPAAATATPPDLSTMSTRERFDRLYRRVMEAAESGDTTTVARFAPMAFAAYSQLDSVDADARYHAAVLQLHIAGDSIAALRLADSILATSPHHLFGFLIRGTEAQLVGDQRSLRLAQADFLAAWDAEQKAARPEYRDHQAMLQQFHDAAKGAAQSGGARLGQ
jgi:hypothetical protein